MADQCNGSERPIWDRHAVPDIGRPHEQCRHCLPFSEPLSFCDFAPKEGLSSLSQIHGYRGNRPKVTGW